MARLLSPDEPSARGALAAAGVEIRAAEDGDVPAELVRSALPPGHRDVKAVITADPPATDPDAGMGAWHVNAVDELHLVTSGEGLFEFVTGAGAVGVLVEPGDVVWIRGAEHRYRPLTSQGWVLRFAGEDLAARETGRASSPWPLP